MSNSVIQFAVITNGKEVVTVGKTFILTMKPQCKENDIKWFDDKKLIKRRNEM